MTAPLSIFYLYRQRLPAAAPQSIQILSTCHALARAGAEVVLRVDQPLSGSAPDPRSVLADYGLEPCPGLRLTWNPHRHPTLAGLEFRGALLRWFRESRARGLRPVLLSRRVEYAAQVLRLSRRLKLDLPVFHEWHYVPSANALEAGQPDRAVALARDEATVLEQAAGHIAVSQALADYLRRYNPPSGPLAVIPNGGPPVPEGHVPPDPAHSQPGGIPFPGPEMASQPGRTPFPGSEMASQPGRTAFDRSHTTPRPPRVVYAGLFRRPRDFDALLASVPLLPPGVELIVLGGDEEGSRLAEVEAKVREAGLAGRLNFLGPLSPVAARALLANAEVGVATFVDSLNMRHFACPLKILEYQAAGLPLVSTDHPTVRELVRPDETGLLVPPVDPSALARAIRRLLDEPALARRLAEAAGVEARERTWEKRGERVLEFVKAF